MQCRQTILTFLGNIVGVVQYGHATSYHLTEETTNAFEQQQGWNDPKNLIVYLHHSCSSTRHDTTTRIRREEKTSSGTVLFG